jgi:hypothetical protein
VKAYFALSMQFCTHPFDATQIFSETKRRNICLIKQEHFVAIMMVNRKPRTNKRHILKGCPEPEEAQGTEAYFDSGTHHLHLSLPSCIESVRLGEHLVPPQSNPLNPSYCFETFPRQYYFCKQFPSVENV